MTIKKISLLIIFTIIILNIAGCSSKSSNDLSKNEENIQEKQKVVEEIPKVITSFVALGKTYSSSKNLSEVKANTDIYDDQVSKSYVPGAYKELDFANDLLYAYVNQNQEIYNNLISFDEKNESSIAPITEVDKIKLQSDLKYLREQMKLLDGETMVLKLDKVTYRGKSSKTNKGASFKIRVAISAVGDYSAAWNSYNVEVYEEGNKLVAHLF
ncbi:hypothetical protein [Clostridium gasigenes]|uniref:hypothetical protein n=1 Tax=Clostridium gasigenes TaxID=94869 RepID=UPI001C0D1574|nr:hypothetical protein [Clostridium gasigenes]MBU3106416.1 hypothetical protein [Clostridium gasigenes]